MFSTLDEWADDTGRIVPLLGKQNHALGISQGNKPNMAEIPPGWVIQGQDKVQIVLTLARHAPSAQEVGLGTLQEVLGSHEPLICS